MSWDRAIAAAAMVDLLTAAAATAATVYDHPPATFNVPALIVGYPANLAFNSPTFCIDSAEWIVTAASGIDDPNTVDTLLAIARNAISDDVTIGGTCQYCRPTGYRNWRGWTVAGAEFLLADLALDTRM